MRQTLVKLIILVGAASMLVSCATTTLVDTWRNPGVPSVSYHKMLVMSITKIQAKRRLMEDILVNDLRSNGVQAVPSYRLIARDEKPDRQKFIKAVNESGVDAVLTVQTVRVEKHVDVEPSYIYPDYWYPWQAYPGVPDYYDGMAPFYGPSYVSTYEVASIQASLFDARNDSLVWAASLESSEPGKVVTVSKDLARLVVQALAKAGLI